MGNDEEMIIRGLVEVMEAAIRLGDWEVDGACDPDLEISRAKKYLETRKWPEINGIGFQEPA